MATTTITVNEIRPPKPGGKKYVLVDTSGDFYYLWPDAAAQYQVGQSYDINYTASNFRGSTIRNVDSGQPSAAPPQQARPRQGATGQAAGSGGYNTYRETSATDAERMMVTALVRAGVQAGSVALNEQDLTNAINDCRAAWRNTFGNPGQRAMGPAGPAPRRMDMNDDIPFAPEWR